MSELRSSVYSLALMAVMLAGGVVLPLAHRVHHGFAHLHLQDEIEKQHDHVHASAASFSNALDGLSHAHPLCEVCATLGAVLRLSKSVAPAADVEEPLRSGVVNRLRSLAPLGLSIRGPPPATLT